MSSASLLLLPDGSMRLYTDTVRVYDVMMEFPGFAVGSLSPSVPRLPTEKLLSPGCTYTLHPDLSQMEHGSHARREATFTRTTSSKSEPSPHSVHDLPAVPPNSDWRVNPRMRAAQFDDAGASAMEFNRTKSLVVRRMSLAIDTTGRSFATSSNTSSAQPGCTQRAAPPLQQLGGRNRESFTFDLQTSAAHAASAGQSYGPSVSPKSPVSPVSPVFSLSTSRLSRRSIAITTTSPTRVSCTFPPYSAAPSSARDSVPSSQENNVGAPIDRDGDNSTGTYNRSWHQEQQPQAQQQQQPLLAPVMSATSRVGRVMTWKIVSGGGSSGAQGAAKGERSSMGRWLTAHASHTQC